MESVGT